MGCFTVNIDIFAKAIFSLISRSAIDERQYDVSEKIKYDGTNA